MGRTLVLHVPLSSPVARSPALLVFTCTPWKRAAKDPLRCKGQKLRFRKVRKPQFFFDRLQSSHKKIINFISSIVTVLQLVRWCIQYR